MRIVHTNKAINGQLVDLYQDYYGDTVNDIVYCGVVEEEIYRKVYPKIVFLLREPHSENGGFSIPDGLRRNVIKGLNGQSLEKGYMYTWRQAGVWAYALIHGFDSYETLRNDHIVVSGLQAIGMVNLKKTGGSASSNHTQIKTHAKAEREIWLKELEIMSPDIIITGNVYHTVIDNLGLEKVFLANLDGRSYYYSILKSDNINAIILDFWHPNNRFNRDNNLKNLKQLTEELKNRGLLIESK